MWHPAMYGYNAGAAAVPLQQMNFNQWWFHGYIDQPPAAGVFMDLPAGGTFHGEVHCNRDLTSHRGYKPGEDIMGCNLPGGDGAGGPLHSTDKWGIPASETKNVKGCGLAIAYKSDAKSINPEDFTVISTNDKCPWRRAVDFQIPANLPKCPPGGCHCLWGWIHSSEAGTQQMYQVMYRCQVTGQTGNVALPAPKIANKCPTDRSNCTVGAKQPHYWLQNERNNNNQWWTDPPYYNSDYGYANGAQFDLWDADSTTTGSQGTQYKRNYDETSPEEIRELELTRRVPPQARRHAEAI
jgi:hypothetical protein